MIIQPRDERGRVLPLPNPSRSGYRKRNPKFRKDHCEGPGARHHWELHLHHIDNDYTNFDPSNLLTLCRTCHLKAHGKRTRRQAGWVHRRGAA